MRARAGGEGGGCGAHPCSVRALHHASAACQENEGAHSNHLVQPARVGRQRVACTCACVITHALPGCLAGCRGVSLGGRSECGPVVTQPGRAVRWWQLRLPAVLLQALPAVRDGARHGGEPAARAGAGPGVRVRPAAQPLTHLLPSTASHWGWDQRDTWHLLSGPSRLTVRRLKRNSMLPLTANFRL